MDWNFGWMEQHRKREGMVGISESAERLVLVYGLMEKNRLFIKAHRQVEAQTLTGRQAALRQFVVEEDLTGVEASYVLGPLEYHLSLMEAPQVAKEEVSPAIRWLLKDSINYPIEDAIVDTFEVPYPRAKDNTKMVYAVAMNKNRITAIETLLESSGLQLKYIDIPELVLKNVMQDHPAVLKGCVFIQLDRFGGKIILCRAEQICIARSFDLKLDGLGKNEIQDNVLLETLALEIQRSFDYLNSVFRQNIQNVIVLAPSSVNVAVIQPSLKGSLGSDVSLFKMEDCFSFEKPLNDSEIVESFRAIGAVLRQRGIAE
jgi:MSHA biogenesis protein MshI